jgi:hypothetical protein
MKAPRKLTKAEAEEIARLNGDADEMLAALTAAGIKIVELPENEATPGGDSPEPKKFPVDGL